MNEQLDDLLKHTSRSLYLSARLFPPQTRDVFSVAYLLCRYADSIADTTLLPPEKRLQWIVQFPQLIWQPEEQKWQQLVKEISSSLTNPYEEKLLRNFSLCLQAFHALKPTQKQLIMTVVQAVCKGMQIDLQTFPSEESGQLRALEQAENLENYCHYMGGAPGIFWSELILSSSEVSLDKKAFLQLGQDIGDGLQIVNILRDLPQDLHIGRCYFPQTDLQEQKLSVADLLNPQNSERFEPIKQKWIEWGRKKLQSAYAYFAAIPKTQPRYRAAMAWPVLWAADNLNKLEQEKHLLDPKHRVKISRYRIYGTMLVTPPLLLCNSLFNSWLKHKLTVGK